MTKILKLNNLNEIIFSLYIFSISAPRIFGKTAYTIIFIISTLTLFIISLIKNKKIFIKKDIILLIFVLAIFIVDFFFRRNQYMLSIYINFFRYCYIPCYFFNRTRSIRKIMKYLSFFSKIIIIVYIYEPFFGYPFSGDYMGYGYTIMLPALFEIYIYYLIRRDYSDLLFLILGFLGIAIFGNRTCLLSIIFLILLTFKLLIRSFKKRKKTIKKQQKNIIKKTSIMLLLFVISFGIRYLFTIQISNNETSELQIESYSLYKYEEMFEGNIESVLSGRTQIYLKAIEAIKDTYSTGITQLLFGNGTGYFRTLNNGIYSHSIILDLMLEYGIIGTALFGGLFVFCLFKWLKNSKKEKFLFGAYLLCLAFPKLLLSQYFQRERGLFLFIVFVLIYFMLKNERFFNNN